MKAEVRVIVARPAEERWKGLSAKGSDSLSKLPGKETDSLQCFQETQLCQHLYSSPMRPICISDF